MSLSVHKVPPPTLLPPALGGAPNCAMKVKFQKLILNQYWDFLSCRPPFWGCLSRQIEDVPEHYLGHLAGQVPVCPQDLPTKPPPGTNYRRVLLAPPPRISTGGGSFRDPPPPVQWDFGKAGYTLLLGTERGCRGGAILRGQVHMLRVVQGYLAHKKTIGILHLRTWEGWSRYF